MAIDLRPTELDVKCKTETQYHMTIRHRQSGAIASGSGENKYALECKLLEKLRERMKEKEDGRTTD